LLRTWCSACSSSKAFTNSSAFLFA
jgi:hypothetical protein